MVAIILETIFDAVDAAFDIRVETSVTEDCFGGVVVALLACDTGAVFLGIVGGSICLGGVLGVGDSSFVVVLIVEVDSVCGTMTTSFFISSLHNAKSHVTPTRLTALPSGHCFISKGQEVVSFSVFFD